MEQTAKEIAFVRGLTVEPEWTQRFTDFFDETVKMGDILTLTYLNAGAGNHAIEITESLGAKTQIFPVCETAELRSTAQLKADATNVDIDFSTERPFGESDYVICDASLQSRDEIAALAAAAVGAADDGVALFLPTAGTFGEIFSFLWEVFSDMEIENDVAIIEELIGNVPTTEFVEDIFKELKLRKVESKVKNAYVEFESGKLFVDSPMMQIFFFPKWIGFLDKNDKERALELLAQKIDENRQDMAFGFTVKATVVLGKR